MRRAEIGKSRVLDYDTWLTKRRAKDPKYIGVNREHMLAGRVKYPGQRRSDPLEQGELRLALAMPPRRVRELARRHGVKVEDMGYKDGRPQRPVYSFTPTDGSDDPGPVTAMWSPMTTAEVAYCRRHGIRKMGGF